MSSSTCEHLSHGAIARRYKLLIGGTFALLAVENILEILIPFLLGNAIDSLIVGSNTALLIFTGIALASLAVGTLRRIYDTRAYGRIYRETATETVENEVMSEAPVSQMTARANFVSEFVDFFEMMLPAAITSFVTLVGAVFMLAIISPILSAGTVSVAIIVALVFFLSRRKIKRLNTGLNDELERQVSVLETRNMKKVGWHLSALVRWRIRLSDLEARNFGIAFYFAIMLLAAAVYVLISVEGKSPGQAFAALTYILQFTESIIVLPVTYQEFLRTKEISGRLA